jgi:aquaporin Z
LPVVSTPRTWNPALAGTHFTEWACELAGTAIMVGFGLSAVAFDFGAGSPVATLIPDHSLRLLLTGMLFAGGGALVTISPLGRRSGAHLNPAVTIGFWLTGHVRGLDVLGYIVSQLIGGILGAAAMAVVWGPMAASVNYGRTLPGPAVTPLAATAIEAVMTAILASVIFGFVSWRRTAKWTPLAVWVTVTLLVWLGAPYTGTSLNPARSLGPDVVAHDLTLYWVYVVGPLVGASAAALAVRFALPMEPLTAKLFHKGAYRSIFKTALPDNRGGRAARPEREALAS